MPRFELRLNLVVDVEDEHALREAAFENAAEFERGLAERHGHTEFSATDSVVTDTGSALLLLGHDRIQMLPGVTRATPQAGCEIREIS